MTMPKEGTKAPAFELKDADGKTVKLSDFKGKKVVLYFYPRDDTPGCTTEACEFRDALPKIKRKNTVVLGISKDDEASHQKFIQKYNLNFILLADPERNAIEAYGAWGEKSLYGKKFMGIIRSTFVLDEDGTILKVFPKVSPAGHAEDVLKVLDEA
ncbi:MAG: thioredoxin-dependent thiol peroxidase [archaeon]|nr:thioredoxin-dependent thiol peroxidase [archaeon]